jgi:hypothetical protein
MFSASAIAKLPPFHEKSNLVNVIIDTPKGAPYKLKYEEKMGIFRTSGPAGTALLQAIRTLTTMTREGKNAFRILLEFEEPKVG